MGQWLNPWRRIAGLGLVGVLGFAGGRLLGRPASIQVQGVDIEPPVQKTGARTQGLVCECGNSTAESDTPAPQGERVEVVGPSRALAVPGMEYVWEEPLSPGATSGLAKDLLKSGRILEAYKLLCSSHGDSVEVYHELAQALAAGGFARQASEMFAAAAERGGVWDSSLMEDFVAHDALGCLAFLDLEIDRQRSAGISEPSYGLGEFRGLALYTLGRWAEAIVYCRDLDELLILARGHSMGHLDGEPWEWGAWMEVDPLRVESVLDQAEEVGANVGWLRARLFATLGHRYQLEAEVRRIEDKEGGTSSYGALLVELAPERGWEPVRHYLEKSPHDEDAVWAYGDYLVEAGRRAEAIDLWGDFLHRSWARMCDAEEMASTVTRAPAQLTPVLEELYQLTLETQEDPVERADDLGNLGDVFWLVGSRERATTLWARAVSIDPDCGWFDSLRHSQLGIDPLRD